jgi:hypothetical protein
MVPVFDRHSNEQEVTPDDGVYLEQWTTMRHAILFLDVGV